MPPHRVFTLSCLSAASAVALGAFGAHGLKKRTSDPAKLANWGTAAQYQLIHSLALTLTTLSSPHNALAQSLFCAGIGMFSGSLYALVLLEGERWDGVRRVLGPVTPVGGVCLVAGWVVLGVRGRGRGVVRL